MRNFILTALLATSVAMPALAQEEDYGRRNRDRGAATEQSGEQRPARPERPQRAERQARQVEDRANWSARGESRQRAVEQQQAHEPAFQQPALRREGERRAWTQRRQERSDAIQPQPFVAPAQDGTLATERRRHARDRDGYGARDATGRERWGRGGVTADRSTEGRTVSRYSGTAGQWSNQWRTNRTYDWRRHRDSHRSLYRLGRYSDPYGSRYRRFSIGFSLFPSYYRSNYWLDDPFMYRLPRAYGPYRWVRYYGDALLVNVYTGRVVDVVYDFFW